MNLKKHILHEPNLVITNHEVRDGVILNPEALTDLYETLKAVLPELKQYVEDVGDCDHSVGICICGLFNKLDNIEKALAKAEAL